MTTVIANTTIVTGDAGRTVLHQAGIAISADRIVSVGPTDEVRHAHPDAEVVDGRGKAGFPRPHQLPYAPARHRRPGNTGGLRLPHPANISGIGSLPAER